MVMIKNASPGRRIVNAKVGKDGSELVELAPGEEREVEILNPDDPVFKGMCESGDLVLDGEEVDQEELQTQKYLNDPKFITDRRLAEEARLTLADPFPEGTEVEEPGSHEGPDDGSEEGASRKGGRRKASKKRHG
jgi:hypothetical protein